MICADLLKDLAAIVAKHAPEPHSEVTVGQRQDILVDVLAYLVREPFFHKPQGGNSCELARTKRAGGAE